VLYLDAWGAGIVGCTTQVQRPHRFIRLADVKLAVKVYAAVTVAGYVAVAGLQIWLMCPGTGCRARRNIIAAIEVKSVFLLFFSQIAKDLMDILNTGWIVIVNRDIDIGLVIFFVFTSVKAAFLSVIDFQMSEAFSAAGQVVCVMWSSN